MGTTEGKIIVLTCDKSKLEYRYMFWDSPSKAEIVSICQVQEKDFLFTTKQSEMFRLRQIIDKLRVTCYRKIGTTYLKVLESKMLLLKLRRIEIKKAREDNCKELSKLR